MEKMPIKNYIIIFILGAIVALFGTHAWVVYKLRTQVRNQQAVIQQIVNLINTAGKNGGQ